MANKTIPELGQVFTASDLDYLVITNSGETTTSKITRQDLLSGTTEPQVFKEGTGTDSITPSYLAAGSVSAGNKNTITNGTNNSITSNGSNNFIGGASNATIASGNNNALLGGNGTISNVNSFSLIGSSPTGTISGGNDTNNGMYSSLQSTMGFNGAYGSVMLGGYANYFKNFYGPNNEYRWSTSLLLGGYNNRQADDSGTGNGAAAMGVMLGGMNNQTKATNPTRFPTFISTESSVIQGGSSRAVVIGGSSVNVNATDDVIALGLVSRTPTLDKTTYTENIHTYLTESYGVVAGGSVSGNVVIDCSLGSIYTFSLGGNITQLDFQNLRSGQRLEFIVDNTTFTISGSALIDGVSGNVYSKNGTISPSNNSITHYTATYDGTRLFLDEEGQFSAV